MIRCSVKENKKKRLLTCGSHINVVFSCRRACLPVLAHCTFTDLVLKGQKCKRDGQLQHLVSDFLCSFFGFFRESLEFVFPDEFVPDHLCEIEYCSRSFHVIEHSTDFAILSFQSIPQREVYLVRVIILTYDDPFDSIQCSS